ncbi:DNA cytosine methyltransferase [candidate division WOR-3 bacterium]|nr:DNA cytosine methyltransferase [candidate division WOR-3 bacterium]
MAEDNLTAIDIFSGGGGLSEGFYRAGFNIISHIERDRNAVETLKTRVMFFHLKKAGLLNEYYGYLYGQISRDDLIARHNLANLINSNVIHNEISDQNVDNIVQRIKLTMKIKGIKKIDVLMGGPPCQAYSLVGRARDPYNMERDRRNYLYKHYVEFLKKINPEIFIFENVPGVLSAGNGKLFDDIQRYMNDAGYEINYRILNSADFAVLQNRKRVILIGWKKGNNFKYPTFERMKHSYRVKDILDDMPVLKAGEGKEDAQDYKTNDFNGYLRKSEIRTDYDRVINHVARPHRKEDLRIYKYAINKYLNGERLKYTDLPQRLQFHKNKKSFLDRFKVIDRNAPASHTVVAHIAKDGHYYIHPDINQLRSLTVREVARLQSFPDNYKFEGPRTAQFVQVGNAVPPLMAEAIGQKVKEILE